MGPETERWTDGGCTGFPDSLGPWNWSHCCVIHDLSGTDGQLLDCISAVVPHWAAALVAYCVFLMILFNPVYDWLHAKGWVK